MHVLTLSYSRANRPSLCLQLSRVVIAYCPAIIKTVYKFQSKGNIEASYQTFVFTFSCIMDRAGLGSIEHSSYRGHTSWVGTNL